MSKASKLVAGALLGEDSVTIMVNGKTYCISPPTIIKLVKAAKYLDSFEEGKSLVEILGMLKDLGNACKALSVFIQGDESISDELSKGTLEELANALGTPGQFCYVIPNIAAEFGASMSFVAKGEGCSDDSIAKVKSLYDLCGDTLVVTEKLVEPGMMMASCGIAYVMRYIRAQMEGGCEMGFYPQQAKQIALQTMQGAVSLLKETGWHPEEAIDKVTTPGGITIKGLNELDHCGFNSAVIKSLKAGLK